MKFKFKQHENLKFLDCDNIQKNPTKALGAGTTHSMYTK